MSSRQGGCRRYRAAVLPAATAHDSSLRVGSGCEPTTLQYHPESGDPASLSNNDTVKDAIQHLEGNGKEPQDSVLSETQPPSAKPNYTTSPPRTPASKSTSPQKLAERTTRSNSLAPALSSLLLSPPTFQKAAHIPNLPTCPSSLKRSRWAQWSGPCSGELLHRVHQQAQSQRPSGPPPLSR